MARTPVMAGNWRMSLNHLETDQLVQKPAWFLEDLDHGYGRIEVAIIPPFTDLRTVQTVVDSGGLKIKYGAQDVSTHDNGAYTGEISANVLVKLGCTYVVVDRLERRGYHDGSNELIDAKVKKAFEVDPTPIICYSETLEVRKEGRQVRYVIGQIDAMLAHLSGKDVASSVIAYELIWATGARGVAASEGAQKVYGVIRRRIAELYDDPVTDAVRAQYGGSVKSSSIVEIMAQPDVDNVLVGGTGLKADEFVKIMTYYK